MSLTMQERLKDLRVERGLGLEELAEQTGLSRSALGNYEKGDTTELSIYALKKLADFYGVTTDYLLARSEMKKHPNAELDELWMQNKKWTSQKERSANNGTMS